MALTTHRNTAGCCDGSGQVHSSATDDPAYVGPLSYVDLCRDPDCIARREAEWARECGEGGSRPPVLIVCRARQNEDCLDGEPSARQFEEDMPLAEDGTYLPAGYAGRGSPASIVCTPCYIALGLPLNPVLPRADARRR